MLKCCLFLFALLTVSNALDSDDCQKTTVHPAVCNYMALFNKNYSNHTELKLRARHIMGSSKYEHNGVVFGHTSRSDRFQHEKKQNAVLNKVKLRHNIARDSNNKHTQLSVPLKLPPIDWRNVNGRSYVTSVKNQGSCGGCFAFAAASVLEYWSKTHGNPKDLSVQHFMDCTSTRNGPNDGCDGGLMEYVFQYSTQHSVVLDTHYPYQERTASCPHQQLLSHVQVRNWKVLEKSTTTNAEHQLEKILHDYGPVSVGVDSTSWDNYKHGIFKHTMCGGEIDHAVTIVGYTRNAWIVKNSWGTDWGMDGYIHLERGHNACGVAEYVAYVTSAYPIIENRPSIAWN